MQLPQEDIVCSGSVFRPLTATALQVNLHKRINRFSFYREINNSFVKSIEILLLDLKQFTIPGQHAQELLDVYGLLQHLHLSGTIQCKSLEVSETNVQ